MRVALVNTNRIKPPIAPIGLDYVAEGLHAAGMQPEILDLCWAEGDAAIASFFRRENFALVGVTLRNTDDCVFTSRHSFLPDFAATVKTIRRHTDAPIVLGGVGFSVMPEIVLGLTAADAGVWADGEFVLPELARRIAARTPWEDLPNLIVGRRGRWSRNPVSLRDLSDLPPMSRGWVDHRRYFQEGGQGGIETKRGCPCACIYCADPLAKGREIRLRPAQSVAEEWERLLEQGVDHTHTCDTEFNRPEGHALEVCREVLRRGLGEKIRWYAYCSPVPFSCELARMMYRAGCRGINFGVDSGDAEILHRLKRDFTPEDILQAVRLSRGAGLAVMLDLLLGSPGESEASLRRTIELAGRSGAERIGVAVGVRVYPGTELARRVAGRMPEKSPAQNSGEPVFFLEPRIAESIFDLLDGLIGGDRRFFFYDPSRPERNYNYNANRLLAEAIRKGYRGAYWDILRRCAEESA